MTFVLCRGEWRKFLRSVVCSFVVYDDEVCVSGCEGHVHALGDEQGGCWCVAGMVFDAMVCVSGCLGRVRAQGDGQGARGVCSSRRLQYQDQGRAADCHAGVD